MSVTPDYSIVTEGRDLTTPEASSVLARCKYGCVYAIRSESGRIKVGASVDCYRRLNELQIGHWETLELIYVGWCPYWLDAHRVEQSAHVLLQDWRIRGEWYVGSVPFETVIQRAAKDNGKLIVAPSDLAPYFWSEFKTMTGDLPDKDQLKSRRARWDALFAGASDA